LAPARATVAAAQRFTPRAAVAPFAFGLRAGLALAALAALATLAGCGSTLMAGVNTVTQAWRGGSDAVDALPSLNPQYRYLRVHVGNRVGLMVQGGADSTDPSTPTLWFSADGAVLRLQAGRLVGLNDGARSFSWLQPGPAPDWPALLAQGLPHRFQQTLDLQPGYRLGQPRQRAVKASAAPSQHQALKLADRVQWFEERTEGEPQSSAWYAVDLQQTPPRVVYGQTCLEPRWCVSWQPWGLTP
jgi:hypothetical protein